MNEKIHRGYVYIIINTINNKKYIGSRRCSSLEEAEGDKYWGSGAVLKNAIKKHGIENFKKQILAFVDNAYELEEKILMSLDAANNSEFYNLKNSGAGGMKGYKASEETIQKLKSRKLSAETRQKISKSLTGIPGSSQKREKLRKVKLGTKLTSETIEKIKMAKIGFKPWNKGKKLQESQETKEKRILQLKKTWNEKKDYKPWNIGKKNSLETRKKMALAQRKRRVREKQKT